MPHMPPIWTEHPLGFLDLEDDAAERYRLGASDPLIRNDAIRCCVRNCPHWLAKRSRGKQAPNSVCPDHGISVSTSPTYVFDDYRRNFIIDAEKLDRFTKLKVESWRLGNERSEDALSWNVFVGLTRLNELTSAFRNLIGIEAESEPELYLWGIRYSQEEPQVWDKLIEIRDVLERRAGIPTEPDIILRIPGRAIVLIEAKFGSPNGTLSGQEERFGEVSEFLHLYPGVAGKADPLDREWIEQQKPSAVLQQLVRNIIFAQWLAGDGEKPIVVNLVRESEERDVADKIANHLAPDSPVSFRRCTWESLFRLPTLSRDDAQPLKRYLVNKTNRLAKAFRL
ncbi:MAG: hypothetical protein H6822_10335 [Planctomycetaceae bacterium]|nr:hypothetical protein [Planctomycetaceae bacterium]